MAVTTTTVLEIEVTSKAYTTSTSKAITPVKQKYEVPVVSSERNGIKSRIAQMNTAISANDSTATSGVAAYGWALANSSIFSQEAYEAYAIPAGSSSEAFAKIDRISGAKMTIVETENVYNYLG